MLPGSAAVSAPPLAAPRGWTGRGPRLVLAVTAGGAALLSGLMFVLAVLVDRQGEILADRSEAHGGFDPSVFPPFDSAIWLLANTAAGLAAVVTLSLLVLLITTRTTTR